MRIPMIAPNPPRLSEQLGALQRIELSGLYSNYGPVNTQFENALISAFFDCGSCVTVCNATIGLMLAIRDVLTQTKNTARPYALMPSFTFAATAQAALWNGLTPLFCDIDPRTWLPCADSEAKLLEKYKDKIAVVIPYATFGNNLDLGHYEEISNIYGVPIVVDAAASLGSLDELGRQFGDQFSWPVVFSMHATKLFATGEGGVVYCNNLERIKRIRSMGSFGFENSRSATLIGLNSKLSEIAALSALLQLERFEAVVSRSQHLSNVYLRELPNWERQELRGTRQARAFESVLLPPGISSNRDRVLTALATKGIGCGSYFSPHLAQQPLFLDGGCRAEIPVTDDIAARIVTLPLFNTMTDYQVKAVSLALMECCADVSLCM